MFSNKKKQPEIEIYKNNSVISKQDTFCYKIQRKKIKPEKKKLTKKKN